MDDVELIHMSGRKRVLRGEYAGTSHLSRFCIAAVNQRQPPFDLW